MIFPLLTVRRTWRPALPACRAEHKFRITHLRAVPGAQGHAQPPRRRPVGRPAAAAGHRARADHPAETASARRADRGHPAQHHPADRAGDRAAARSGRDGDRAGRAVFRLRLRPCRPVLRDRARGIRSDTEESTSRSFDPIDRVVKGVARASRSGERKPCRLAWATTAKTRPESSARRLPVAESTRSLDEHPRASTMPVPNMSPPMAAPERLCGEASCRASVAVKRSNALSSMVPVMAVEKTISQMATLPPICPRENSIAAARRQNRLCCAKAPKIAPITAPPIRSARLSPKWSARNSRFMVSPP
jgi:hypothetical protein